jgi:hypothetical protein
MKTRRQELTTIRDYVIALAEGRATKEIDKTIYQMFGSLTKEQAQGLVIGLNLAIREIAAGEVVETKCRS